MQPRREIESFVIFLSPCWQLRGLFSREGSPAELYIFSLCSNRRKVTVCLQKQWRTARTEKKLFARPVWIYRYMESVKFRNTDFFSSSCFKLCVDKYKNNISRLLNKQTSQQSLCFPYRWRSKLKMPPDLKKKEIIFFKYSIDISDQSGYGKMGCIYVPSGKFKLFRRWTYLRRGRNFKYLWWEINCVYQLIDQSKCSQLEKPLSWTQTSSASVCRRGWQTMNLTLQAMGTFCS